MSLERNFFSDNYLDKCKKDKENAVKVIKFKFDKFIESQKSSVIKKFVEQGATQQEAEDLFLETKRELRQKEVNNFLERAAKIDQETLGSHKSNFKIN